MVTMRRSWAARCCIMGAVWLMMIGAVAWGDDWTPINCPSADLPPEAMFDTVRTVDSFEESPLRWQAASGEQNARCHLVRDTATCRDGQGALRVDYDFVGQRQYEYLQLGMPLQIPTEGLAFGFWLKHDGHSFPVRLRIVDKSGETHQIDLMSRTVADWQFVACSLDGPGSSWGGDGNGRLDYPCRLEGIVIDRPRGGFVGKGSLWIDGAALLRHRSTSSTLQVVTRETAMGNLFAVGASIHLRAHGKGDKIRWQWSDYWGHVLAQGEGSATGTRADFVLPRPGYFVCRMELSDADRVSEVEQYSCAAIANGAEEARSDFVGVCTHYGHNSYPLPSMDLLCRYGIDQFRDEISWESYERRPGQYAMPEHAADFLRHAAQLNMRPLIIYDYSNRLYDGGSYPNSPAAIDAFAAYAVDLTRQTRGTVAMFEVWNEWIGGCGMNGRSGDHGPEAYGRLLNATYAAVKQAFPDVCVVGIGGEYGAHCAENIATALSVAGPTSLDGWSIHPYRYPHSAEQSDLVGEVERIADRVRETAPRRKHGSQKSVGLRIAHLEVVRNRSKRDSVCEPWLCCSPRDRSKRFSGTTSRMMEPAATTMNTTSVWFATSRTTALLNRVWLR